MIQLLSDKYRRHISWPLFFIFYLQIISPLAVHAEKYPPSTSYYHAPVYNKTSESKNYEDRAAAEQKASVNKTPVKIISLNEAGKTLSLAKVNIGGPGSPEASSFKAVGSNNLVNLASGDFSYSIPLLDVGGYPVNLFYTGGITMEQEASWVGLGWNINPGAVSRNMRGVPDDFNGTDLLTQHQNLKPNRTWGGEVGVDLEFIGLKNPKLGVGGSLGFSYNNYIGPELSIGAKVSISLSASKTVEGEKKADGTASKDTTGGLSLTAGLGTKLSSRSGLTFSPSLSAGGFLTAKNVQGGVGLNTSYNSRTGIKDLNVHSEMTHYSKKKEVTMANGTKHAAGGFGGGGSLGSSNISFAKPSYLPSIRMPMQNSNYNMQLEFGGAIWGIRVGVSAMGYYSESKVPEESRSITKPLVGYMYSEKAYKNSNAVMDFNRLGDAEVTPNTPIISAPQYNYDVFSIQGEGTGGSIRAYRGDLGYVRDNVTASKEKNISVGIDLGIPFHLGVNVNVVNTPTRVGGWESGNNTLRNSIPFTTKGVNGSSFESVYFKNPGEASVTNSKELDRIGNDNLVRFQLSGSTVNPRIESRLEQFNKKTNAVIATPVVVNNNNYIASNPQNREKRTQVITMLSAEDASKVGLDKTIKSYREGANEFDANNNIVADGIKRDSGFRKPHHISQIDVLEQGGMRYVYGLPVYSIKQKDFTFTVKELPANANENQVAFASSEPTISSEHMGNKSKYDGYMQSQETPAYAASFLLSGLLSPDYVDVTDNGITEDDLGSAVKFDYTKSDSAHKWRTPRNNTIANSAHFNEGLKTEKKDNKASISYGEREVWYLNAIESKSMVAIFKTDTRNDAKGVRGEMDGRINNAENANKKLTQIDLYTKAEIKAKGYNNARPIKSVKFEYDYSLCNGTPDNLSGGKLTLKSVYFSYNGQVRNNKDRYVFNYGELTSKKDNPLYSNNASDRWGTYKPALDSAGITNNPAGLTNADFPYTLNNKSKDDIYAGAWSLKKILLPSGAQMEVQYEADDYGYVQNRRACNMLNIAGLGQTTSFSAGDKLYNNILSTQDNNYVYVQLPQALTATNSVQIKREIFAKYLEGISLPGEFKLAFKLLIKMPNGWEPLTIYPEYDDYGICTNNSNYIYIHLTSVDGKNGLVNSSLGFLTENIPGQAFNYGDDNVDDLRGFIDLAGGMLSNLKTAFQNVNQQMRLANKGKYIDLNKSFVRLANPAKNKYGGGYRIKSVRVKNNWNKMTGAYNSVYGQDYDYTTSEKINGVETTVSSGVASYEPGIGSEENPFREIVGFKNKMPLASAQYGAIEMPMLEGLYPSPNVVYSKVTVRSIHRKGTHGDSTLRSAIGKQVTEFYTAKDYPSYSSFTPINSWRYKKNPFFSFFYKEVINYRTISQGFLVETNDMHGKMKSQLAYSESDEKTPLSASYHTYKNTGKNGLNDKVDFVYNNEQGAVHKGNMGVDMELMTDVREFSVKSNGLNVQMQVDLFVFYAVTIPLPTFFPLKTHTEDIYRAVTCTKLINYHAIEDSVIVMDKGSVVSTKTIAYDAETGSPIVTKTANEFNDTIYNASYPAYWAYSSTGLAYKNINREFSNATFSDGKITVSGMTATQIDNAFESGDELYVTTQGGTPSGSCVATSNDVSKLWVFDKNKNTTALTLVTKDLVFMDSVGKLYNKANVNFRIMRSGKRNNLGLTVSAATAMKNPIQNGVLVVNNTANVITASAVEFKEKWQTDNDIFKKLKVVPFGGDTSTANIIVNGDFNQGNVGFTTDFWWNGNDCNFPCFKCYKICNSGAPHGNIMSFNGFSQIAWQQSPTVFPNREYTFSASFYNTNNQNKPTISITINNFPIGNTFELQPVGWQTISFPWNSGNATNAVIKIWDTNGNENGNDFALDDISFKKSNCGLPTQEVQDCIGYLEKNINPYVKGLIGNYKPYRSYTYYGDRGENINNLNTTIRKNGYLLSFNNYWSFNSASNLVPDITNTKWVWNSELTKVNSKGQELETKDALNRYTAAQYGFAKNMPVAMTQNARYGESFGEGFEDDNYVERINTGYQDNCPESNKYISFSGISIENASNYGINAHTGSKVLKINQNSVASKTLNVKNIDAGNFDLLSVSASQTFSNSSYSGNYTQFGLPSSSIKYEYCSGIINTELGTNIPRIYERPINNFIQTSGCMGCEWDPIRHIAIGAFEGDQNGYSGCSNNITGTYPNDGPTYIKNMYYLAPHSGTYNFSVNIFSNTGKFQVIIRKADNSNGNHNFTTFSGIPYTPNYEYLTSIWYDAGSPVINNCNANTFLPQNTIPINVALCAQEYYQFILIYTPNSWTWNNTCGLPYPYDQCGQCGGALTQRITMNYVPTGSFYSTRTVLNNTVCNFAKPIPATDNMQNPTFFLQPGKKMLFSAWVKEDCSIPCAKTNFTLSNIEIWANGSVIPAATNTVKRTGTIIEGWQKIEGEFTLPSNATSAEIRFINSNTSAPMYVDDIRMHPYNANMKSYVYDARTLRLSAELDENNHASFYEYDEEGQLVRVKKETIEGIKTIQETRSSKQKVVTDLQ